MASTPSTRPLNDTGAECLAAGAHRDLPPESALVALTFKRSCRCNSMNTSGSNGHRPSVRWKF